MTAVIETIKDSYFTVMLGVSIGFGVSALPILIWRSLTIIERRFKGRE